VFPFPFYPFFVFCLSSAYILGVIQYLDNQNERDIYREELINLKIVYYRDLLSLPGILPDSLLILTLSVRKW
jgi:hypothetical protein